MRTLLVDGVRPARSRWMRRAVAAGLGIGLMVATVAPVAAAQPTVERTINIGFHHEQHYNADPLCGPGVTEIYSGNEHLIIVDRGDALHITYGETFKTQVVFDDPSLATFTRQGTDAITFNLLKDGNQVFHESFHDYGPADGTFARIRVIVTFVYVNGEVQVDREMLHDIPPC